MDDITDARLAAQRMIQVYGDGASAEAVKRAEDAKNQGQIEAENMWKQIGVMISELSNDHLSRN